MPQLQSGSITTFLLGGREAAAQPGSRELSSCTPVFPSIHETISQARRARICLRWEAVTQQASYRRQRTETKNKVYTYKGELGFNFFPPEEDIVY